MLTTAALGQQRLPLHKLHQRYAAKMTPFAGYEMPVSYGPGVLKEHLHTRASASLFDVSHMGQFLICPRSGSTLTDVALALESVMPIDLLSLRAGRQRYGFLTTENGGIADDLVIANLGGCFLVIVNAARKAQDEAYLRKRLMQHCHIQPLTDRVLLALQGPCAGVVLAELAPAVTRMRFMDAAEYSIGGVSCWVMRSGYTGEDGFELSLSIDVAADLAQRLLMSPHVRFAGLGARDSLRLEAGLCLYGYDLDHNTTPVQAALEWAISASRRTGGARIGGFPGASIILAELRHGVPMRRVGLRAEKRPVRAPAALYLDKTSRTPVGRVTSAAFGPSLNAPVAMGYVHAELSGAGTRLCAEVRNERLAVTAADLPFIPHRYLR
jgi:aminomethyltransferase